LAGRPGQHAREVRGFALARTMAVDLDKLAGFSGWKTLD
jgi:hypothetical protein